MSNEHSKFQSKNIMGALCLGVALAGVNTLIVVWLTLAFVII